MINGKCVTALTLLLTLIGCGGSQGPDRHEVNGTVTLDGEPVKGATIQFLPQTDDIANAPTANGFVNGGEFRIVSAVGPIAGPNNVEIRITEAPDKPKSSESEESGEEENEEEYAEVVLGMVRTQVTVEADGENQFDFNFESSEIEPIRDE